MTMRVRGRRRSRRLRGEEGGPPADDGPDDEVELVDQAGGQETVPEGAAAEDQDCLPGPPSNSAICSWASAGVDDARCVAPRFGLVR